ncbi:MAG: TIR domain-containing protein [Candidatus Margulisiibacteriota bacterium]
MPKIILIDDDPASVSLVDNLHFRGHDILHIKSASEALHKLESIISSDLIILDIIMPWPEDKKLEKTLKPETAGMEIFRAIRKKNHSLPIIVWSATQDLTVIKVIKDDVNAKYLSRYETSPKEMIENIYNKLGIKDIIKAFIVHGQNDAVKLELKNYLQNILKFPEPIILHEQPSLGRTIIEKFEDCSLQSSIVFVILTPDDVAIAEDSPDDVKRRARQNVIFEMGYFLGVLGRKSGRIILLYKAPLELPSDISGVIYIDISNGIDAKGEEIRLEVKNVGS